MYSGEALTINDRDYRLDTVLSTGAGSYGQVWAATDSAGGTVALKLINAEAMAQVDPSLRGHWRAHLEREIVFLNSLDADQSRHIVTLIDAGLVDGQPVLVMERLQADLGQWLAQQRRDQAPPPDLAQILDWAGQILDGLDVVHRAGFVYRDLKFSNVLVGQDGALLKLADFGALRRENGDSTRSFIGTPATMAPEQALPVRQSVAGGCEYAVDYRADYYALGLLLFILFTGQPATAAQRRLGQLLALHGQEGAGQHHEQLGGLDDEERGLLRRAIEFWTVPVATLPGGGVAAGLTDLITRLLARDPADRPQHSAVIQAALAAAHAGQPVRSEPVPERLEAVMIPDPNLLSPLIVRRIRHRVETAHASPWLRRGTGLLSLLALAGTVAWAILPLDWRSPSPRVTSPTAMTAPVVTPDAATHPALSEPVPAPEPTVSIPKAVEPAAPVTQTPLPEPSVTPEPAVTESAAKVGSPPEPDAALSGADPPAPGDEESAPPPVDMPSPATQPARIRPPAPDQVAKPVREKPAPKTVKSAPPVEPVAKIVKPPAEPVTKTVKAAPPTMAPVAKSAVPPAIAPAAVESIRKPLPVAKAAPALRDRKTPVAATRPPRNPSSATPPVRPVNPSRPVARAESRPAPPALPPIELESRRSTPPPIELESRRPAPPPINLVSRSEPATRVTTPPAAPVIAPAPPPKRNPAPPSTRSGDPVNQFREDASRAAADLRREAEAIGNWASRAGQEVQRGLDRANRTVNQWTGQCGAGNDCHRPSRVERRDRWVNRTGGTVSQRPPPLPEDEESGFVEPPPQYYR